MRLPVTFAIAGLALLSAVWPASADNMRDWGRVTSIHIARFLRYPPSENRAGWAGRAFVRFKVGREGNVRDVVIAQSSGRPALDRAAIAAVRAANPVPAPGWLTPGSSISATLPVSFRQ